jgi:hypothetical protein
MSLTLDLPPPINEELTLDSQREGISEMEHAALLVCLASAFKQDQPHTPFQKAIRVFLSDHSLDAEQVVAAFEKLVSVCLAAHGTEAIELPTGKGKTEAALQFALLQDWRNETVHRPLESLTQAQSRLSGNAVPEKEGGDPGQHVRALLTQWQSEDRTPLRMPATTPGETPTQALFRKWAAEDANMSDEEKEAEDRLWEDIEQGNRENQLALSRRRSTP